MQQKSNNNNQPPELNLETSDRLVGKSLGELDNLLLEKAFLGEDSSKLAYPKQQFGFTPENALYITEIDDKFCFLDYTTAAEIPQPIEISHNSLITSELVPTAITKTNSDVVKKAIKKPKPALLVGKKALLIGLGLGVFLTLGASRLFSDSTATNGEATQPSEVAKSTSPAQTVTVVDVEATAIANTTNASGTVRAFERVPVMSQATGLQVTEVLAERGDYVERGQVLARLNNKALMAQKVEAEAAVAQFRSALDELQAGSRAEEIAQAESRVANAESAVTQAESDLELVQTRVERNRSLQQEGAITRDDFDDILNQEKVAQSSLVGAKASLNEAQQALAQLKAGSRRQTIAQAEAQLIQAQGRLQAIEAQLEDTEIVASASGTIVARQASVGQITSTSEMLFSIIQNGRLELRLQVPETLIGKIQSGQSVMVTSNADRNLKLTGKVREIDPSIDDSSRQAVVKVDLPSNAKLKPGMFLQGRINTDSNQGLAVPIEALLPAAADKATVFVLQEDNTVKAQTVEMGEILDGQKIEVISGLTSGDRIVLKGAAYLKDGDRVKVQ